IRAEGENTSVAHIKVWDVMALPKSGGDKLLRVITKTARSGLMLAIARCLGLLAPPPKLSASRFQDVGADLLGVLPHQQFIGSPLEVEAQRRYAENVLYLGVDVYVVVLAGKRGDLRH